MQNKAKIWLGPIYHIFNQTVILLFEFLARKSPLVYNKRAKELVCYVHTYLSRVLDRLNENIKGFSLYGKKIKKILVIRLDKIGDVVWVSPVFTNLRKHFPDASITVIVGSWAKPLIEHNPYIDRIITYDIWSYSPVKKTLSFINRIGILYKLIKEKYDLILNLRTSLGFLMLGVLTRGIFIGKGYGHGVEAALYPLRKLGINDISEELSLFVGKSDDEFGIRFLEENGVQTNGMPIAIHPGAGWVGRQWDPDKFAVVADELSNKYETSIILFGSPDDVSLATRIANKMKTKPIMAAGKTNLMQMASILKRCALFIGHDTGPMHIAVALKIPVVVLWGAAPLEDAHPWTNPSMYKIIKKNVDCSPCLEIECKNGYKCIQDICISEVISSACSLMSQPK